VSNQIVIGGFGGTSKNLVLGGYGDNTDPTGYQVQPAFGSLFGGEVITIYSTKLSMASYVDRFVGSVLDPTKWTDTSAGGTAVVSNKLVLSVPTTGGTASIASVSQYKNFSIVMSTQPFSSLDRLSPIQAYDIQTLTAYVNAGNSFSISNRWDPTIGRITLVKARVEGVDQVLYSGSIGIGSDFTIRRHLGTVVATIGSSAPIVLKGWTEAAASIRISSTAPAGLPGALTSIVNSFVPSILVTFGDLMSYQVTEFSGGTLQVSVPASTIETYTIIEAHLPGSTTTLTTDWHYIADSKLSVGGSLRLYTFQDSVLRD
jgi:hypothetical protein